MKQNQTPQMIHLNDGRQVIDLSPKTDRNLAIVDVNVIGRLAKLLPSVDFDTVRAEMMAKIDATKGLEEMVNVMQDEIAFHETVNLITLLDKPEQEYPKVH